MGRQASVAKCFGMQSLTDVKKHPLVITGQPSILPPEVLGAFLTRMDLLSARVCRNISLDNAESLEGCDVVIGAVPLGVSDAFSAARNPVHAVVFRDPIETTLSKYLELLETPTHPLVC